MYTPSAFQVMDAGTLNRFMRDHPFATLVSSTPQGPVAPHLPLEIAREEEEGGRHGLLVGHVAKANSPWRDFGGNSPSLAIFHGPHAYISPAWYVSDSLPPTWNYATVHAYGRPRVIEDPTRVRGVLDTLVERFEGERSDRWTNALAPAFMEKLQAGIVAFEFSIEDIEGKFKLGQNRLPADQAASLAGLSKESGRSPDSLAAFWSACLEGESP